MAHNGNLSHTLPSLETRKCESQCESIVYGVLFVFGCNGTVPDYLSDKMSSKYILCKRAKANGLKEASSFLKSDNESLPPQHVITYRLSNNSAIVVTFKHDPLTDMFQIGRYQKNPIDFTVYDVKEKARHGVSRFACRILVRRDGNHEARIYAAAYDPSQSIFLGESAVPCYRRKMDGFTTNGVLIMQPQGDRPGEWREVSVSGNIYPLRSSNMDILLRPRLYEESNVLQDGTLIDLCGVTLVWRTPDGLKNTPSEEYLSDLQRTLHRSIPEWPLLSRDSSTSVSQEQFPFKRAYVHLSCGHVIRLTQPPNVECACPVCRVFGPVTELIITAEPGFYIDREFPLYAFKPCGHVASQKTVEYWSSVTIPDHRNIESSFCPFCGVELNFFTKNVKLYVPNMLPIP